MSELARDMLVWLHRVNLESGQTLVEYGLIVSILSLVAVVILTALGQDLAGVFSGVSSELQNAVSP